MFTKIQLVLFICSIAAIIGNFYTINAENTDELFHCDGENLVAGARMEELRKNCSMELHSTPDNTTCLTICMMQHMEGLDDHSKPTKVLFDKVVDEKFGPDLREKAKKTDCFDHADKIEKGDKLCETLHDFETCMTKMMEGLCKAAVTTAT